MSIQFNEEKQEKELREFRLKEAEDLAQMLAQKHGITYTDLSILPINTDALRLIPEKDARNANMAAFRLVGMKLHVALVAPGNKASDPILNSLEKNGYSITKYVVSERSIERALERYKEISYAEESEEGVVNISDKDIDAMMRTMSKIGEVTEVITKALQGKDKKNISSLVEVFIAGALGTNASDIHIEPGEKETTLRLRLDGVLQDVASFEHSIHKMLLSRIKLLSGLKINIKDEAQDGRFSIRLKDGSVEVRTSSVPGTYGESIVMRVLNPDSIRVPIEELGMESDLFKIIEEEISKPHGMLINTGPTGSGKTTTLYAILSRIQTPEIKIVTIEDPVEYHLPGITQTQVDKESSYTFAKGLRAALRQDPDVIMVGEIRDKETATTAVNAALTGHLLLSTLHTNSAAGSIPRLIDIGIDTKIIGSALNIAIAQRLVRKLCEGCKTKTPLSAEEKEMVTHILETIPSKKKENVDTSHTWKAGKCEACNKTGYKGRIGVFEAVRMDDTVEELAREKPGEREIKKAASEQGLLDMLQDGILKSFKGITSIEEVKRVVGI
jgi:type IV pilus assembly protein PilB